MQPHLIFGLVATIGAMGELAGHERRGSLLWPARSAVIGLMGAALGLPRDGDFSALDALEIEIAIFDIGQSLRDYHTAQTVPSAAAKTPNSRPEAILEAGPLRLNTTITHRDYRSGLFYGIAVRGQGLEDLAHALNEPCFTLYLGRKSCPLAAPTGAKIVFAENSAKALSSLTLPPWRGTSIKAQVLIVESDVGEVVHDRPRDRHYWHFAPRRLEQRPVNITLGGPYEPLV